MTVSGREAVRKWYLRLWHRMALFGIGYFLAAELAGFLSPRNLAFVSFWMPAGLSMAVLLMNRTRDWPWLLLAILPANLLFDTLHGVKIPVILGFYCANVVEYGVGAWLVRTFVGELPELETLMEFIGLIIFGAVFNSMLGAVIGAATLVYFGASHSFAFSWRTWWGGNMMAIMVVTPFILAWFCPLHGRRRLLDSPGRIVEATLLLAGMIGALWNLLASDQGALSPNRVFIVPFILWAGLRFGVRGATGICLVMALAMSFFSARAFSRVAPELVASGEYIFIVQTVMGMATLIALIPAIVLAERDRTMARLRESEEHYRNLTQAAFEGVAISENGRLLDVNDEIVNMLGYEREELIGRLIVELVAPESRDLIGERIRTESGETLEHRLVRKDGSFIIVEARAKSARLGERTVRMTALRDITARKKSEQEREEAVAREQKARAQYTLQLIASQEAERERIAGELHDSLGQNLSIIKNQAQLLLLNNELPPDVRADVEAIGNMTALVIADMRRISQDLHPYQLDHLGLTGALDALVESAGNASTIAFRKRFEPVDDAFSREAAASLYRIVQEGVNNILKYSEAKNSRVTLERDVREALLVIEDDGRGFKPDEVRQGMGLKNIAERARILGGRLQLDSSPGHGVRIELAIPILAKDDLPRAESEDSIILS
ncbi:MAG TPA: MASE1 domain-containing protein [Verrucomicrobiae bacterium]|jgi:PAS domain S-box-containing protein|nr:MASE1 domain-containing protein [Verrucomicrobiae bacterium]